VANTLAYYDTATITAVKSFIVQAPGLKLLAKTNGLAYLDSSSATEKTFYDIDTWTFCLQSLRLQLSLKRKKEKIYYYYF
jgi:hypothetical protein